MLKKEKLIEDIIAAMKELIPNHNQDHPYFYQLIDELPDRPEPELENLLHTYSEQLRPAKWLIISLTTDQWSIQFSETQSQ